MTGVTDMTGLFDPELLKSDKFDTELRLDFDPGAVYEDSKCAGPTGIQCRRPRLELHATPYIIEREA